MMVVVVVVVVRSPEVEVEGGRCVARSEARLDRVLDRLVRFAARSTGFWAGSAGLGPVDRLLNRISRDELSLSCSSRKPKPNRPNRRETMELEAKSWGNSRSSTTTPNPRTKTTQNATKSQIGQEAIWGYFWGFFGKFSRNEIGWVGGQIRGNQELLIPYDEV